MGCVCSKERPTSASPGDIEPSRVCEGPTGTETNNSRVPLPDSVKKDTALKSPQDTVSTTNIKEDAQKDMGIGDVNMDGRADMEVSKMEQNGEGGMDADGIERGKGDACASCVEAGEEENVKGGEVGNDSNAGSVSKERAEVTDIVTDGNKDNDKVGKDEMEVKNDANVSDLAANVKDTQAGDTVKPRMQGTHADCIEKIKEKDGDKMLAKEKEKVPDTGSVKEDLQAANKQDEEPNRVENSFCSSNTASLAEELDRRLRINELF